MYCRVQRMGKCGRMRNMNSVIIWKKQEAEFKNTRKTIQRNVANNIKKQNKTADIENEKAQCEHLCKRFGREGGG